MMKAAEKLNFALAAAGRLFHLDDRLRGRALNEYDGEDTYLLDLPDVNAWVTVQLVPVKSILPPDARRALRPTYRVGYYKYHGSTRWDPAETEDVQTLETEDVAAAVAEVVRLMVYDAVSSELYGAGA